METSVVVALVAATPVLVTSLAQWRDMRRRTNGAGPIAGELKEIKAGQEQHTERLVRIEERVGRTEERVGRIEAKVTEASRLDRVEEKRVHLRDIPPMPVAPPPA